MSRFLFFSSCTHPWGGSEELWAGAAAELAAAGHRVSILKTAVDPDHPRIRRMRALGCRIRDLHRLGLPRGLHLPRPLLRLTSRGPVQRALRPLLRAYLARFAPDLAIVSQGGNFDGLLYGDLCRSAGRPYVVISQKASEHLWPSDADRAVMRLVFGAALRCYFVSRHNRDLTQRQIGAALGQAEVVRNPFLVSGAPLPWPAMPEGRPSLACVARLEPGEKGQDILLQVLARPKWRARKLSVSFFGAGQNGDALRELARGSGVCNVAFPGFADDVEAVWKTHHALVLPSRSEGLPLALVEAMMCGRFGIVTDAGGSAEVVEEGRTGFIASAATADAFDAAMERAWDLRGEWEAIGSAAGTAIQALVPADPVGAFTRKLLQLLPRERRRPEPGTRGG